MRLYHFTSRGHLPVILATGGLWRGEVPVKDGRRSLRATWFTSDPDPRDHGLDGSWADKREVRLTVVTRYNDRDLVQWIRFARGRLASEHVDTLIRTGGGKRKAETWYVHWKMIPPSAFQAIEFRREDGGYTSATAEEIAVLVPHEGLREAVEQDFRELRSRMDPDAA